MKFVLSLAAAATLATGAMAAELPSYEVNGFPISPVQAQVVGAAHIREQIADGKTVSPHQISVLTRHAKRTAEATAPTTGVSAR